LVHAWLGPAFADSALVVELLALTVILRVGDATASTLLRGAGQHRFLAVTNGVTALVNLLLSILLVARLGLAGVAIGTLIPVGLTAVFIIFPAGCRRVQLSIPHVLAEAVWPAVWPAAVMAAYVWLTLPLIGSSLIAVGMEMMAAMGVYVVTFIAFGVTAVERRFYASKALQVTALLPLPTASGDL
jgi:O-antigen/teichoic acid export membrane protein